MTSSRSPLLIAASLALLTALDWLVALPPTLPLPSPQGGELPVSLALAIHAATVARRSGDGESVPCPLRGGRHQCTSASWAYVGPRDDVRVAGKKSACVWAHPLPDETIQITYPAVTLSAEQALLLSTAIDDRAISGRGARVTARVSSPPLTHTTPDARGWHTQRIQGPRSGPLTLEISAPKTGRRHFCYRLEEAP